MNGDHDDDEGGYAACATSSSGSLHALLLLSDSALPLGSFAYSSGLESYLAHQRHAAATAAVSPLASFHSFLALSIDSVASSSLPYLLAAYRRPESLETLDNDLDASTPCVVTQRASIAQGRALLGVWERAFRGHYAAAFEGTETDAAAIPDSNSGSSNDDDNAAAAAAALGRFSDTLKASSTSSFDHADHLGPKGHFAPLWGAVCRAMHLDLRRAAYVFVFNHAKAVLSAAVRAAVMGPYQAQNILASRALQDLIAARIARQWHVDVDLAGQSVPALDLWIGRHELLYSRIFNS